jgi:superfamily II DNA or RNA helicase
MTVYTPGTLVLARQRLWRVDGQEGEILYLTAVDEATRQTRLYLPLEKVAPGSLPKPDPNLVGTHQAHDLMLRAFRLSMVHSTAPLLALQRSRAIPVSYQLVPLVMALEQPRVRMLIADDVGLGKTIEAGLVISELMARGLARRLLVICPASLREQWRQALDYFFHIDAVIFSRTHRRSLERDLPAGSNLLEFRSNFIVSIDYAKSTDIKSQILEVPWDIVVVDEVHQMAKPHQTGPDQRVTMDRWELGQALASSRQVRHLLLLSATPHNGYTDTFASLLRLLDVGAVAGPAHNPQIQREIARRHIVQRRRQDVEKWMHEPASPNQPGSQLPVNGSAAHFPVRDQDEITVSPSTQEQEVIGEVQRYGELILENARAAQARYQTLAGWVVLNLHKRALSSPKALRCSLENRREALEERLAGLTDQEVVITPEAARADTMDEETGEQDEDAESGGRAERVVIGEANSLRAELAVLEQLQSLADRVKPANDSKLQNLLRNTLRMMLAQRHKVIIFTRYRDTLDYVAEQIKKHNLYQNVQVITLHGGMNEVQRQEAFGRFEQASDAVLVATDAISEGVNLQFLASQLIHYELPWNPNRLEQRNGRIDRFGQPEGTVVIRTLVMDEALDAIILQILVRKARQIRSDYGFSPPYFGDESNILDLIQDHGLTVSLAPRQLGLFDQQAQPREHLQDPFDPALIERISGECFYGQTDLTLSVVEEQMRQVQGTIGSAEEIRRFVLSGLDRLHCTVEQKSGGIFKIHLSHPELQLPGLGNLIAKATFDPAVGLKYPDANVLDLGHPLVRRLMDILKRQTFEPDQQSPDAQIGYGRTAVMLTKDVQETTALYTLLVRYTTRTQPPQILEDLVTVALPVYGEQVFNRRETERLTAAQPAPGFLPPSDAKEVLSDALVHPELHKILGAGVEARRLELEAERARLRQELRLTAEWMAGADRLEVSSWDQMAVKILWPV